MAARTRKSTAVPAITDPFRASGKDLKVAAAAGDAVAIAEVARRAAKKATTPVVA